jgi:tRNA-dihydrouridine synthase B
VKPSTVRIGQYAIDNPFFLAPMAGVTDRPFRQLCKHWGAGHVVSEMAASNPQLWATDKSTRRLNHEGESAPITVQIAGGDPDMMAQATEFNIRKGAQIIDINMGCPAKKVCNVAAGSALLKNEAQVEKILRAVVGAASPHGVPVSLKFRTGWSPDNKNALRIGQLAEDVGVQMLTLHGRTRACGFAGQAEYDTIASLKQHVRIPVVANGDIRTPQQAVAVMRSTGADAVMIGRAAQGRPWIFREMLHFMETGETLPPPRVTEVAVCLLRHLQDHHAFYGEFTGVRTARKHLQWYLGPVIGLDHPFMAALMTIDSTVAQLDASEAFFDRLAQMHERLPDIRTNNNLNFLSELAA